MAQLAKPASSEPDGAGPIKADDLMRRGADSIMARVDHSSTQRQAEYMYASLPTAITAESSYIRVNRGWEDCPGSRVASEPSRGKRKPGENLRWRSQTPTRKLVQKLIDGFRMLKFTVDIV